MFNHFSFKNFTLQFLTPRQSTNCFSRPLHINTNGAFHYLCFFVFLSSAASLLAVTLFHFLVSNVIQYIWYFNAGDYLILSTDVPPSCRVVINVRVLPSSVMVAVLCIAYHVQLETRRISAVFSYIVICKIQQGIGFVYIWCRDIKVGPI